MAVFFALHDAVLHCLYACTLVLSAAGSRFVGDSLRAGHFWMSCEARLVLLPVRGAHGAVPGKTNGVRNNALGSEELMRLPLDC
jgi:hypothetical protein